MKRTWLLIEHHDDDPTIDLWVANRRVLRVNNRRAGLIDGRLTPLYAHKNGRSVLKSEITSVRLRLRLLCGVLICTRWGSAMLQWRGFDSAGRA